MRLCGCGPRSLKGVMDPSNPPQEIIPGHFNRANTNPPVNKPIIPNSASDSNKYEQIPEKDVAIVNTMLKSSGTPSNKSSRRCKEQPKHDSLERNLNESDESRNPESLEIISLNSTLLPRNVATSIELNHPSSKLESPDKEVLSEDNEVEKVTINDTFAADIVFAGADFNTLKKRFEDRAPTEDHATFMNELADIESNVNQLFINLDRFESPELLNKTQSISPDPCKPKLNELRQEIISFKETLQEYDSFIKSVQAGSVYTECLQRMKQQSNIVKVEVEAYSSDKDMDHLKLALATLAEVKESRELITEFLNDKYLKENLPKIMIQPKEIDENINDWVNKIQFEIDERTRSKECSDNPVEEYTNGLGLIADNFFPSIEKRIEVFNQPVKQPIKRTVSKKDIETNPNFQELRELLEKRIKQNT